MALRTADLLPGLLLQVRSRYALPLADAVAKRPTHRREERLRVEEFREVVRRNQPWVADLTYVATWRGFVYVAFVIDVFSRPS
jgi:transposase InsO family protein